LCCGTVDRRRRPLGGKHLRISSKILATLVGNLYLVFGSVFFSIATLLVAPLPPRGHWSRLAIVFWARGLLFTSGIRVEANFAAPVDPERRYIYLSNHQSLYDIPVLLATAPGNMRMVAKKSLFRIPIFGWAMQAGGFVSVDREDKSRARDTFSAAESQLDHGISLLLFPEGTRSQTDALLPFQRGGFLLALKQGLPIIPVGVQGTRPIQRRGSRIIHPGTATVFYGEPIDPAAYGVRRKRELIAEVRQRIATLSGRRADEEPETSDPVS
jgi:1-acyl-sn-glycerol-3-phosphate acyltransferase